MGLVYNALHSPVDRYLSSINTEENTNPFSKQVVTRAGYAFQAGVSAVSGIATLTFGKFETLNKAAVEALNGGEVIGEVMGCAADIAKIRL